MDVVTIRDETIRLGQLLKLHGVAEHGAMAKDLIAAGDVRVNGEVETRRGATIRPGDRVNAIERVIGIDVKESKFSGRLVLQYVEATYYNQHGDMLKSKPVESLIFSLKT